MYVAFYFVLHALVIPGLFSRPVAAAGTVAEAVTLAGPYYEWFVGGSLPIFLGLGNYLLHGLHYGGKVKRTDEKLVAVIAAGFLLWFGVLFALSSLNLAPALVEAYNVYAGYVFCGALLLLSLKSLDLKI